MGNRAVFTFDAAKAFNSVESIYLWKVLERFGVGKTILEWIKVIYSAPSAHIRGNCLIHLSFTGALGRGVLCHSCSLPWPWNLRPLAIQTSPEIVGFRRGQRSEVVSLYTDDTLLYLGDTTGSLQAYWWFLKIVWILNKLGQVSADAIRPLDLMPLDLLPCMLPKCLRAVEVVQKFKYLGIQVSPAPTDYIWLKLVPILTKFCEKCSLWCKLPLSVVRRINLIKMVPSSCTCLIIPHGFCKSGSCV